MASSNTNVQIADLDFVNIKNNLKTFLQGQSTLQDYNFEGSALSVLLDILAYNTQYNAFYLNMVANEMFLDTAIMRPSVVSHAKLLDYVPKSSIAPTAFINLTVNNVTNPSLTLPAYTSFLSEAINGVNYNFVNPNVYTVNTSAGTATFTNVELKQGTVGSASFTVDLTSNPTCTFDIPDANIDTTTLVVQVQQSSSNSSYQIYSPATDYLILNSSSTVYFIQESLTGTYQIYFGDGILGTQLTQGNVVNISYIITDGTAAYGANNFVLMNSIGGLSNTIINPVTSATQGGNQESIASIQFQAPKSYATQGRAVTKDDYITMIQQNQLGYSFDAVNVWGGQENNPPVYGQVFVAIKPTGSYTLTDTQKTQLIENVLKPISIMTVVPTIIDPDYTYLKIIVSALYDPSQTVLTSNQIQTAVINATQNFAAQYLNTFNSTFLTADLTSAIQNADPSILTNDFDLYLQKKFYPNLTQSENYNFYFNCPLVRGVLTSGISSSPALQFRDPTNPANIIDGVFIEEVPTTTVGVASISLLSPGYSYQSAPTVTISGDGSGATAVAIIDINGQISSITVTNAGQNYTQATVTITPASTDNTGTGGSAVAVLEGQFGTLRSYYYNANNIKTIFSNNVGTVDYTNGVISLNAFAPFDVDNPLGQLTITANPITTIVSSQFNRIITVDPFDPTAVIVNVTAKS